MSNRARKWLSVSLHRKQNSFCVNFTREKRTSLTSLMDPIETHYYNKNTNKCLSVLTVEYHLSYANEFSFKVI